MFLPITRHSGLFVPSAGQFRTLFRGKHAGKPLEKAVVNPGVGFAPLFTHQMFQRIFTDKRNMNSLLNSAIESGRLLNVQKVMKIHHINLSVVPTTNSLPNHVFEETTLYDCWCTFDDGTMGSLKLIKTSDYDTIGRDVVDCAKMDYWKQWHDFRKFAYPVRVIVLNFGMFAFQRPVHMMSNSCKLDLRHACPGLHHLPPPGEYCWTNIWSAKDLSLCTDNFERWCFLMKDSFSLKVHAIPAALQSEPFARALGMLDMSYFPTMDAVEVLETAKCFHKQVMEYTTYLIENKIYYVYPIQPNST